MLKSRVAPEELGTACQVSLANAGERHIEGLGVWSERNVERWHDTRFKVHLAPVANAVFETRRHAKQVDAFRRYRRG